MATPAADDMTPMVNASSGEALPRELDHRIANSLQLAADFLLLRQLRLKDPFARAALIDAAERLVAVGHLHRFLCEHEGARLVELGPFLKELAAIIGQSTGLKCRAESDAILVPAGMAQQLGLAANELAVNAAKHAYARSEAGEVMIRAQREGDRLRLTVTDHGHGLGKGFSLASADGLGMGIVRALAAQLHAELGAEDDHGARFTLVMPLATQAVVEQRTFWEP